MKAAVYDRSGPAAEVLRVVDIERPEPGPGEVRVRVRVSGINPTDVKSRGGTTPRPIDGFQIPHQDGAGVIDAVGPGGPADRIGQRVWVYLAAAGRRWGTAAEWTVVPENHAVPLPDGVGLELGASLGVPALTAHHLVFADGPVKDATVLVAGGRRGRCISPSSSPPGAGPPGWPPLPAARPRPSWPGRPERVMW